MRTRTPSAKRTDRGPKRRRAATLAAALLLGGAGCASDGSSADGSVAAMSCAELAQAYADAVDEARDCDPEAATEQCTIPLDKSFACACRIFVRNNEASDSAYELARAFQQQKCQPEPCPEQCSNATSGVCAIKLGNLTQGRCESP